MHFHRGARFITAAVLLLAPIAASAQLRDGNLIEYGGGAFNDEDGSLVMLPPEMKIFRDGRVLIVNQSGAWQARIEADRLENLERDLLRNPLLQASRYVEFARRKPIPNAGGLSYIRFRDAADEVIVITPGFPLDPEWKAIIDRVKAERPPTLMSFRPQQLRFYVWSWPDIAKSVPWPFTSTVPLAGRGDDPVSTSDPAVIAFIVDDVYTRKAPLPGIEENGKLYQFGVESAPGWMDPPALQVRVEQLWLASAKRGRGVGAQDGNLIEYGMGGFADGGHGLMLYPPEVKIYADGRVVFGDKEGIWQGMLEPRRLERLKSDLSKTKLLAKTQILPVRGGGLISMHGGMAYIRYRDGDDEKIVAVLSHPHGGPYTRLLGRIRQEIPSTYSRFRPKEITFRLYPGSSWVEPVAWPFSAAIPLHGRSDSIAITDAAAIGFVIDHAFGGFSWLQTNVIEDGVKYEIILESSPGWYEPGVLASTLEYMRLISN